MCRIAAYLGDDTAVAPLVLSGNHSLYEQSWAPRELLSGSVNADGYGVAWYSGGPPARISDSRPIWQAHDLPDTLGAISSTCVVAALRNGTPGIPLDPSGVLPLVFDSWTFALNGFIPDFRPRHMRTLRASLSDGLYGRLAGSSDSETLFLLCVNALHAGASLQEALMSTAHLVAARLDGEEAQLNMLLTDGLSIAALRTSTVERTNSLYLADRQPFAPGGLVIASEPLDDGSEWSPVPGHSWLRVEPDGSRTSGAFDL